MDNWGQETFTLSVSRLYRRAIRVSHDQSCAGFGVAPFVIADAENGFQPVQRDIQQQEAERTPLRGPGVGRMPTIRVQIPCLKPLTNTFPAWEGANGLQEV